MNLQAARANICYRLRGLFIASEKNVRSSCVAVDRSESALRSHYSLTRLLCASRDNVLVCVYQSNTVIMRVAITETTRPFFNKPLINLHPGSSRLHMAQYINVNCMAQTKACVLWHYGTTGERDAQLIAISGLTETYWTLFCSWLI